jgi:hypothetical protein
MIKKFRNIIMLLLLAIVVSGIVSMFVYWAMNPEMTEMQVFIELWWVWVIDVAAAMLLLSMRDK